MKGVALDMRHYPRMFSATRLPREGRDVWHKAPPDRSRHIVVLRGQHFWEVHARAASFFRSTPPFFPAPFSLIARLLHQVPVLDEATGLPLSVPAIEAALQRVCDESAADAAAGSGPPSLAVLTAAERDSWARWRAQLASHAPVNRASLSSIDDALFRAPAGPRTLVGRVGALEQRRRSVGTSGPRWSLCSLD